MASITTMVKRVIALAGTKDVSDWESDFLTSIAQQTKNGDDTRCLTEKQIDVVERLHDKHFTG
jgi:hypothetical protein